MDQESRKDESEVGGCDRKKASPNKANGFWMWIGTLCLIFGVLLVIILVILPSTILILAALFPDCFPSEAATSALNELHDGVSELVAYISLAVGVISIIYAHFSSKIMDEQSQRQENVLHSLQQETVEILKELSITNERMAIMSEKRGKLGYNPPSKADTADED